MNKMRVLALAAGLPVIMAISQSADAASLPATRSASQPGTVIPADFVTVTDGTGTITVGVPSSWTDVDTAPTEGGVPSIAASTDLAGFANSFDVPGVFYSLAQFNGDPVGFAEGVAVDLGVTVDCTEEQVQPYDDGVFAGSELAYTGCGATGSSEVHLIAATLANQSVGPLLTVKMSGPEQAPILDGIKATFDVTGNVGAADAGAPTSTVAPTPTPEAVAPSGDVPAGWIPIVDDTGTISIAVPSTWTAVDVAPLQTDDGMSQPWISATTDQSLFIPPAGTTDTYSVPGVIYQAYPYQQITPALFESSAYIGVCTAGPVQSYDDGAFVGYIQSHDNCGGTGSSVVEVVANPRLGSFTAYLQIQLTGAPDDAMMLDGVLSSFDAASVPTPATAPASDPAIGQLRQIVEDAIGVTITDEQAQCALGNGGLLTPGIDGATMAALLNCGVDVMDIPSG